MPPATKERIFAIADELDANGQKPTLAAVRKTLGAGSFTTISEVMAEWRTRRAAKERPANGPPPQAVADRFARLGEDLWALALEAANARLTADREGLEAARILLEAEKNEATTLADQVTAELEAAQTRIAALEGAETKAQREADDLRQRIVDLGERAATAEARTVEIEKRADDLNAELVRVNRQNADLVKALAGSDRGTERPAET